MVRIVVFDSGFGSLSIINQIQKKLKSEIIYFADQKNFPYGRKSISDLKKIIQNSILGLQKNFNPDLIVVGSNTPSLLLENFLKTKPNIIRVLPPLNEASKLSNSTVAILSTKSLIESSQLKKYIKNHTRKKISVLPVNASSLVDLVESGKFINNKKFCMEKTNAILKTTFLQNNVDVATLSSTHLPFLLPIFSKLFPNVIFLDPASMVAETIKHRITKNAKRNKLQIFSSGNTKIFQRNLERIGIKNKVQYFSLC